MVEHLAIETETNTVKGRVIETEGEETEIIEIGEIIKVTAITKTTEIIGAEEVKSGQREKVIVDIMRMKRKWKRKTVLPMLPTVGLIEMSHLSVCGNICFVSLYGVVFIFCMFHHWYQNYQRW